MEGLWTIVLFGAVVPAGMMATLALLDRRAARDHHGSGIVMRRATTGGWPRGGRRWTS
ncbi:MAG TPA: hypothetical protein VFY87_32370 [Geminicoccaceae bacterium]|nr:hypothetical protein [Geminicoccaceae bacterium]